MRSVSTRVRPLAENAPATMNLVTCFSGEGECVIQPVCHLKEVLTPALAAYMGTLESYTLQDLLEPKKALARLLRIS